MKTDNNKHFVLPVTTENFDKTHGITKGLIIDKLPGIVAESIYLQLNEAVATGNPTHILLIEEPTDNVGANMRAINTVRVTKNTDTNEIRESLSEVEYVGKDLLGCLEARFFNGKIDNNLTDISMLHLQKC